MKKSHLLNWLFILFITASVYHPRFHGRNMSNGEKYNHYEGYTVASNKYPLDTKLEIEYKDKIIKARVTDRMGVEGRIDLSGKAMKDLYGYWCDNNNKNGCTLIKVKTKVISNDEYYEIEYSKLGWFFWFLPPQ